MSADVLLLSHEGELFAFPDSIRTLSRFLFGTCHTELEGDLSQPVDLYELEITSWMLQELKQFAEHHNFALYESLDPLQSIWPEIARDPWDVAFIEKKDDDRISSLCLLAQRLIITPLYQLSVAYLQTQFKHASGAELCSDLDLPESELPEREIAFIYAEHPWAVDQRLAKLPQS